MASTLDVLPTLAALTGSTPPSGPIDGVDVVPLLTGMEGANPRTRFLFYYDAQLRGVREGKWKRVFEHRTRSYEGVEPGVGGLPGPYAFPTVPAALYDLEADVGETTDLSSQYPEVVSRLDALAEEARAALGDGLTGRLGAEVRPPGRRGFDRLETVDHLGVGASVSLATPPDPSYPGGGAAGLCDGRLGSRDHHDGLWMGWSGEDLEAVLQLGQPTEVGRVGVSCLRAQGPWIFLPRRVEVATSSDGTHWVTFGQAEVPLVNDPVRIAERIYVDPSDGHDPGPVRFLMVTAKNRGTLPDWHPGALEDAWLFVDEIVVEGK